MSVVLHPRIAFGVYPQREDEHEGWLEKAGAYLLDTGAGALRSRVSWLRRLLPVIDAQAVDLASKSDEELGTLAIELRYELKRKGLTDRLVARSFALIRETAGRQLGLRHFDVQILGGWAMLNGMVAEMDTGEGKTLTATLPAATAALAGVPVHIITVNDYLAARDAEWMSPVYRALGLSVGVVTETTDLQARREAYACDITYCTNKLIAFDYLRDRLLLRAQPGRLRLQLAGLHNSYAGASRLILRGLCFAIVDEADSVLVDEAVTPLVISRMVDADSKRQLFEQSLRIAGDLDRHSDFSIREQDRTLELTERGKARLEALTTGFGGLWENPGYREELASQALRASHLFVKDKHYLVTDGKVGIVDEFTGRLMADRSWERGLQQMIELKEGCEITGEQETIGRISYQRFFRRYKMLAGMTGTAKEVVRELRSVYRLNVVRIPPNAGVRRVTLPATVYTKEADKWEAIVERIRDLHTVGRPVLAGTRSVAASEHLGELLERAGLPHRVLNARQTVDEAEIITEAGRPAQITVATNMAGRGTDIRIDEGVMALGGLHVIATERHEARRIDRQLFGRCGRQGDPGSVQVIVSLEDELMARYGNRGLGWLLAKLSDADGTSWRWLGELAFLLAQKNAERKHGSVRASLLKADEYLSTALAFSGDIE